MIEYTITAVRNAQGRLLGHEIETADGGLWHFYRSTAPRPMAGPMKAPGAVRQLVVDTENEPDIVLRGVEP